MPKKKSSTITKTANKKNISQKMQINEINFKNDLRSKFSAALIIFYIENPDKRENTFDMIASAKFEGRFREIRDQIIKKTLFKSTASDIYDVLDSKGLNFTKNLLFSNEVRRLCRFASSNFKGDPFIEFEKTINFINN